MAARANTLKSSHESRVFGTFGIYRYLLALIVMIAHTGPTDWQHIGSYSVFPFFILSGYVVSYIFHNSYLPLRNGLWKYAINRALRIYPAYWFTFIVLLWLGTLHTSLAAYPSQADTLSDVVWWSTNILALTAALPVKLAPITPLVPVAWSLCNEIIYWALIPFLLMHRRIQWLVLALGACYTLLPLIWMLINQTDLVYWRYFSPLAACFPFCMGMMIFLTRQRYDIVISHTLGRCAICIFLILIIDAPLLLSKPVFYGFYLMIVLNTVIIAYLSQIDQRKIPNPLQKMDSFFGGIAYPLFLIHFPALFFMRIFFPLLNNLEIFGCTFLLAHFLAALMHYSIDAPVNRLRIRLKV